LHEERSNLQKELAKYSKVERDLSDKLAEFEQNISKLNQIQVIFDEP